MLKIEIFLINLKFFSFIVKIVHIPEEELTGARRAALLMKEPEPKQRRRNFRDAWLKHPEFGKWLGKFDGDITKASCTVCNRIIMAEFTSLLRHQNTAIHIHNSKRMENGEFYLEVSKPK